MKTGYISILFFIILIFIISCDRGGTAAGNDNEISDNVPDAEENATADSDTILPKFSIYFDDKIRSNIISELSLAKESVYFVTYQFSDSAVMNRLNSLNAAGVKVNGVSGSSVASGAGNPGFEIKILPDNNSEGGISHEKFFVIDKKTVLISSANLAFNDIKNFLVVIRDDMPLAALLKDEFDQLFAGKTGKSKTNLCQKGCDISWGRLYFSPGTGCESLNSELKSKASAENYIAIYSIDDSPPVDALKTILSGGKKLYGLIDNWDDGDGKPVNQTALDSLNSAGANLSFYKGSMVWHHKFFVNQGFLEFGSMNWTYSGCSKNDELFITTAQPQLISAFANYIKNSIQ